MNSIRIPLLIALLSILGGCGKTFEPEVTGWKAFTLPGRQLILDIDGRQKALSLPGDERVGYRFAQWTRFQNQILLTQSIKTEHCYDYQIVSCDTIGAIIDTIYIPPPNTQINFKLAPNDSVLLLKTYDDNCTGGSDHFKYTFYNRYLKTALPDTVKVENAWNIPLGETLWSPDSRKVIILEWSIQTVKASMYNLANQETTYIGTGSNFLWSPTDNDVVAYIKDYSIYTMKFSTGKTEMIFEGNKKKGVTAFRWDPKGNYLLIYVKQYWLNMEAPMFQHPMTLYLSMPDKRLSKEHFGSERIDTWKEGEVNRGGKPRK